MLAPPASPVPSSSLAKPNTAVGIGLPGENGPGVPISEHGVDVGVAVGMVAVTVGVGVGGPPGTNMQAENSEVLLSGSVDVAVIFRPCKLGTGSVTVKFASQLPFVETVAEP